MIKSFQHKGLEALYLTGSTKGIIPTHKVKLEVVLTALDSAQEPNDLALPGFRCHQLKGQLAGYWSIWVNGNWRVIFRFDATDVELVDYTDYH